MAVPEEVGVVGVVALMILAVVVTFASNLNYCASEHPRLERAYSVGVPSAVAISGVMGLAGLPLMVIAVSAGALIGIDGFFSAASRVLFKWQGACTAQCNALGACSVLSDPRGLGIWP